MQYCGVAAVKCHEVKVKVKFIHAMKTLGRGGGVRV
jgi:hypothetical protein